MSEPGNEEETPPERLRKPALVTGASRGIGSAVLQKLRATGRYVVGTATSQAGADAISRAVGDDGFGAVLDSSDPQTLNRCLERMTSTCGPPLILVNNAGITRDNLLLRMSEQQWQEVINTNLGLLYQTSKAVLRGMMKARWGRIINLSSVVGRMGNPGQTNYAASKAGIEGFTRALALEVASRNITVNAVAPGFVDTDMTEALTGHQHAQMLERIPLGRIADPGEIAAAICFLAGDEAGYVTGETLSVNGGLRLA